MLYVLYKNTGCHSGRALRKMLAREADESVKGGFPKRFQSILRRETPELVINLGTTENFPYKGKVLNSPDMVRAASNKKRARQAFAEAGVPAPRLFLTSTQITTKDLPVIGRTSYHRKGQGFWLCESLSQVRRAVTQGATHFLQFIPRTREFRVHTFIKNKYLLTSQADRKPEHYISAKISEKTWTGEGQPDRNQPQKNHTFGWTFMAPKNRREEELDVVRYAAKQAAAALGVDFGAVDVMYGMRDKIPYVLEVNSTPSMSDDNATTCEVYANRILRLAGTDDAE